MNKLGLCLVRKIPFKLGNEQNKLEHQICKKLNKSELFEHLKAYAREVEGNNAYDYKRSVKSIMLIGEFLKIGEIVLKDSESRIRKNENQKKVVDELNNEVKELLVAISEFVMRISANEYLRGIISVEFPNILVYLINFASSELIEMKTRCKLLEASLNLLKHEENSRILESSKFRVCLYIEDKYLLKRLWKSMCREIVCNKYLVSVSNLDIDMFIEKNVDESKNLHYLENDTLLFIALTLDIYGNILHFNRFLTDKVLLKNCIDILTENIKILIDLVFSSESNICFKSSIILRSLLLDTENYQFIQIVNYLKESSYILLLLVTMLREVLIDNESKIAINNWVLFAQMISILSQNDEDIFELVKRIFPKKFMRIFNGRWFINKNMGEKATMLPWFPKDCEWYNMNTNVLLDDINDRIKYTRGITINSLNINDITCYGKKLVNEVIRIINLNLDYMHDFEREYTIRRYPDYTWYIFWELCRNNYENQLDLLWNNEVKKDIVSTLLREFKITYNCNKNSIKFKWDINYYYPSIPIISKELTISNSCYLKLLIPTLMKINEQFGLFNFFSNVRFGSNLFLVEKNLRQIGNINCYIYKVNNIKAQGKNVKKMYYDENNCSNYSNEMISKIKCKLNYLYRKDTSVSTNNTSNNIKLLNDRALLTDNKYVLNNDYSDWEIIEDDYGYDLLLEKSESNEYLDNKLMKSLIECKIPYIECIENCEKIRLLFSSLFQRIISENIYSIKSYMLYCYIYYLLVFNEYILDQQLVDHIQYLFLILASKNDENMKYRYHIIYILHIILTLYEKVRKEFINIGGLNIINQVIFEYQKNWSLGKQISIYLQEDTINDISVNKDNNKINVDKYINNFSNKVGNYKLLLNHSICNEIDKIINNHNVRHFNQNLDEYNYNNETNNIYIIEKPELNEMISNGVIYNEIIKLFEDKSIKGVMEIKTHIQLMNLWLSLINDRELNIKLKDYLKLYEENNLIISEIPSGITTNNCVTPKNKITSYIDLIEINNEKIQDESIYVLSEKQNYIDYNKVENIVKIMYENDRINYNELITWLITVNNCLIQSKQWISEITNNDLINYLIRIVLIKNNLMSNNNYHIFWICKILIKILRFKENIILNYMENDIVETLLFTLLRFDNNLPNIKDDNLTNEIVKLLKECVLKMNKVIIENEFSNNNENDGNKRNCNKNCNMINGCIFGDTMCLLFNIIKSIKIDNNIEINETRMINILGYGVYYLSKYLPVSLVEILINENGINLFKKIVLYNDNSSIRVKWNKTTRIKTLICLSNKLLNKGLNIDISGHDENEEYKSNNHSNQYNNEEGINNHMIKKCIEIIDNYNNKNNGLNIYCYNIIKMLNKIIDINTKLIKKELYSDYDDYNTLYNNWLNKSRENRNTLIELIEMDNINLTLIYKHYYLKNGDNSIFYSNSKKYQNIWNTLNYYLLIYFIYFIIEIRNEEMSEYVLENIINIVKLQFNLMIIGISYIKDYNMIFKIDDNEIKFDIDTLFDQFIDKYYQYINNNSNTLICIHENINKIIYDNNLLKDDKITKIFIYNLKILNIIMEINSSDIKLKYENNFYYENNILLNNLNKMKNNIYDDNYMFNSNKYSYSYSSLLLYLLFNDNNESEIVNLLLYSILLKTRNINLNIENEELLIILTEFLLKNEFKNINNITLTLILNIIKAYILNIESKISLIKKGIIPKLLNELNIDENRNYIIIEIIIILYNNEYIINEYNNIITKINNIFNSILTPPLCEILSNKNETCLVDKIKEFQKIISNNIITSKLIWTQEMYIKLKEWCKEEIENINNNKNNANFDWLEFNTNTIDYRKRYYKVVNHIINTNNDSKYYYDYKEEDYIYGINIFYFSLKDKYTNIANKNEIIKENCNSDKILKIIDSICYKIKLNHINNISIYIYSVYKLIRIYGINYFVDNLSLQKNIKILIDYMYNSVNNHEIVNILLESNAIIKSDKFLEYGLNYNHYILSIIGLIENEQDINIIKNNTILIESKIIIVDIIIYIYDEYIYNVNEENNKDKIELLLILLNKLKLIFYNNIIYKNNDKHNINTTKYEYNRIKYIIHTLKLLFWYDHNINNIENKDIEKIILLSIEILREDILCDLNHTIIIKEIIETIIYPLNNYYYKKIISILNIENNIISNNHYNFYNILINTKKSQDFLDWFMSDNNKNMVIINWNKKVRNILYINLKNIYTKLLNINADNNDILNVIKNICKYEYYKNIINYNHFDEIYQLNINHCNNMNNEISYYIIFLLTIKETSNLITTLNTLFNENDYKNKRIDIIINIIIVKYRIMLKLMKLINIENVLTNICNKIKLNTYTYCNNHNYSVNNIITINNNMNDENILLLIEDEIENISNTHPNIRSRNININNVYNKKSMNDNNYIIINDINKLHILIFIKDILRLILLFNKKKLSSNNKLINIVCEIMINIITTKFYSNNNSIYITFENIINDIISNKNDNLKSKEIGIEINNIRYILDIFENNMLMSDNNIELLVISYLKYIKSIDSNEEKDKLRNKIIELVTNLNEYNNNNTDHNDKEINIDIQINEDNIEDPIHKALTMWE